MYVGWPYAEVLWGYLTDLIEAEKSTAIYIGAVAHLIQMGEEGA